MNVLFVVEELSFLLIVFIHFVFEAPSYTLCDADKKRGINRSETEALCRESSFQPGSKSG